jgi:hypothetical protein
MSGSGISVHFLSLFAIIERNFNVRSRMDWMLKWIFNQTVFGCPATLNLFFQPLFSKKISFEKLNYKGYGFTRCGVL